jgi:hypothetical protein
LNPRAKSVRLFAAGKELSDKTKTLDEFSITDRQTIYYDVTETSYYDPVTDSIVGGTTMHDDDTVSPRTILFTNQDFVDQFFELFQLQHPTAGPSIHQKVWEIVMLLPTNPKMLKRFYSLEEKPAWSTLLDPNSTFQLLYALQIVESILLEESDDVAEKKERDEWANRFVALGGFQHVFQIFIQRQPDAQDVYSQNIIESLLKICNSRIIGE